MTACQPVSRYLRCRPVSSGLEGLARDFQPAGKLFRLGFRAVPPRPGAGCVAMAGAEAVSLPPIAGAQLMRQVPV